MAISHMCPNCNKPLSDYGETEMDIIYPNKRRARFRIMRCFAGCGHSEFIWLSDVDLIRPRFRPL